MDQRRLTSEADWDLRYRGPVPSGSWTPSDYNSRAIEHGLARILSRARPASILEVGCGNSSWLPYLAAKCGATATGLDFSSIGCEQARSRLLAANVRGRVFCRDIFCTSLDDIGGPFDFVYSLGFVEHFTDLGDVVKRLASFVAPGGWLFTEVPNLRSIHGLLSKLYQPAVLAKHVVLSVEDLLLAHRAAGLEQTCGGRLGLFSMNVVAWGIEPRFPALDPVLRRIAIWSVRQSDRILNRVGGFDSGPAWGAPFLYAAGCRPGTKRSRWETSND